MFKLFSIQKSKNQNPNLMFLVVTGSSTDKGKLAAVGGKFRGIGIKVWGVGVGPEAQSISGELSSVSTSKGYTVSGGISALVNKQAFGALTTSITQSMYSCRIFFTFLNSSEILSYMLLIVRP